MDNEGIKSGLFTFRFELMWLKFEGFKELLKGRWQSLRFQGSSSLIMASKSKALKNILKIWNKEVFGKVEVKKKEALRRMSFWDDLGKERELALVEVEERERAREDFKS